MMDVGELLSKFTEVFLEIETAVRDLTFQDALVIDESRLDLLFPCIRFAPAAQDVPSTLFTLETLNLQ
ncbi:hypothetical protein SAMN05216337_1007176 [Bradyrhizobium brasilense]|uniref:Uncharacterized protein n=1 Tax=Bradyrhizobium brasilense TaxID=1419277 RepID=A0A1G6RYD8_9BRAD|nr:hypothetical protein [Bradyrhizobium brasilense]SDD09598.1 hypothetical protein SAMN05216337_1007176 [Bradyrhizobium brasilense]